MIRSFADLSREARRHLQDGDLEQYTATLGEMAKMLDREGHYADELKVLALVFYVDLSGVSGDPHIKLPVAVAIREAARRSGLTKHEIDELYMDTVREDTTPGHCMTVRDSQYLLELCLGGKIVEANKVLENIRK